MSRIEIFNINSSNSFITELQATDAAKIIGGTSKGNSYGKEKEYGYGYGYGYGGYGKEKEHGKGKGYGYGYGKGGYDD